MDPSIMKKLLEEDEDETIHSGAEIDAFTAALNRDIQRDSSSFHNSDSDTAAFVQGSNQTSTQFPQWQTLNLDENARCQSQQGASVSQRQDINQHICGSENQQHQLDSLQESKQKDVHIPQSRSMNDFKINPNPNPDPRVQKMSSTTSTHQQTINIMNPNKQVPFALLVPVIEPQLDKDKAIQLQNVYNKLKQNEISKDVFLRHIRSIVGDQLLKMAVYKLHGHEAARISQSGPNNCTSQHMQSTSSPCGTGSIVKTPPKRPSSIGQKKPLETLVSSPPLPGKKQKVSGAFSDQSIDQLNDVTAVSGVNLMEEEEQLFSGPKEYSEVSEASRRVVQEEEERLFLQKIPLHKKLAEIMIRSGLKGVSPDVERCLSLCAEERMRGLLCNLVKLSKQRVDIEKPRHRTVITSDVGQQILMMNRKIREEWEQKQADVEKLQKINDPEGAPGVDGDKDDGRGKSVKMQQANKEEDDKMRTNAANVAARAAFGGDDMFSKWQLMAEQAHQKREGVPEAPSLMQLPKEAGRKPASTMAKNSKDDNNHKAESRSLTVAMVAGARESGKSQFAVLQSKVARSISAKDVIAVLEREPQTLKTRLIYRVYEKMRSDVVAE